MLDWEEVSQDLSLVISELNTVKTFCQETGNEDGYKIIEAMKNYIESNAKLTGIWTEVGKLFNLNRKQMKRRYMALRKAAAISGHYIDRGIKTPPGFGIHSITTMYDAENKKTKIIWTKAKLEQEQLPEIIEKWVETLTSKVEGLAPKIVKPEYFENDLLTVYPLGDPHFGMLAMKEQCGEDFNVEIASEYTKRAIEHLVSVSPNSEEALFISLGDLFHINDHTPLTPRGKHIMDIDTLFFDMNVKVMETITHCIDLLRSKHKKILVWLIPGNHDPTASYTMSLCLSAFYRNDHSVTVNTKPECHMFYKFGKVLIGATHGHEVKYKDLPGLMASVKREDWGQTKYSYWYCGHVHHKKIMEVGDTIIETFRTLAAKDAWTNSKGYYSGRDAVCIVHHKDFGEIERHTVNVDKIIKTLVQQEGDK